MNILRVTFWPALPRVATTCHAQPRVAHFTHYFVLVELPGETQREPGGLFRQVRDDTGYRIDLLTGDGAWTDLTSTLAPYCLRGEAGADSISDAAALKLLARSPWPNLRARRTGE